MGSGADQLGELESPDTQTSGNSKSDHSRVNRHRGLWSFLSRYFYLGQIFIAQQLVIGAAHAGQADDGQGDDRVSSDGAQDGGTNANASTLAGVSTGDETGAPSPAAVREVNTIGGKLPGDAGQDIPGDAGASLQKAGLEASGASSGGSLVSAKDVQGEAPAASAGEGAITPADGPCGPHVGIDTGVIDLDLGFGHGISLDLNVGGLIDLNLDIPLNVAALTGPVVVLVDDVLDLGTDLVDTTLGAVASTVNGLAPVVGGLSGALGGATGALPIIGDVASSGVISFASNAISDATNPDSLFDAGKYTDFNIALRSEMSAITQPLADGGHATTGVLADVVFGNVKDADSIDVGSDQGHGFLASIVPDSTKAGLADLFT